MYAYQRYIGDGVKKGVTYYIRIKGSPATKADTVDSNYCGKVMYTSYSCSGKFGKNKKKASRLAKKTWRKGNIPASTAKPSKKAVWYKITTKNKTFKVSFKGCFSTKATVVVYYKTTNKSRKYSSVIFNIYRRKPDPSIMKVIKNRAFKTTVYIKVILIGNASGAYKIKWQ